MKETYTKLIFVFLIGTATAQELPCLVKREISDQEIGIVERYLDQCTQEHITVLNPTTSKLLFEQLGEKEISIKLSQIMDDLFFKILCQENENSIQCTLKAPIINYGLPIIGMGDYDPNYWMAKYHPEFFIRDGKYVYSPRQEYVVSLNTGANELILAFHQSNLDFEVVSQDGSISVSLFCEETMDLKPTCRIIF